MFDFITKRSFGFNLLIVIALFFVLALLFFSMLGVITKHGQQLTVPDVRGKNVTEAIDLLEKAGFEADVRDSIYVDSIPPLAVYAQTPETGAQVKVGRTIYLTVRKTVAPMIKMPDLEGFTFRSAEMMLKSLRLNVGDTIYKPDFAANTILQQLYNGKRIKPGTEIPEGSYITLVISSGTGSVENPVPNFIGLTYAEAREMLSASNLNPGTIIIDPSVKDTANAYIIKQVPTRKNEIGDFNMVRAGESIDLWLSATKPVTDSTQVAPEQQENE
ncbi:beta-lactam-binding protein with PASTA domain [Chitinophaga terrae (ex Kim and Jung 2007)]|uniref:PASTA domain-containing protein n=1 Tax=Chitinophaga terrae (ex Kim and Jung 2007) TaxID=408074 RepID=UPI00277DB283|nr:PASTA domain-containing protein [Chitinophaga terrae (ex Kim and Jung 2007)]MDQ0110247.1 beta-lactam-binding protein with PASTA domain [Chitinophaga terrae (ex Kim and Jung 2007)]